MRFCSHRAGRLAAVRLLVLLAASAAAHAAPPPAPAAATTSTAPALDKFDIRAQLSPRRYTTLAAELGAKVKRITVKEGERIKAGQLLVSLDCVIQAAQRDKAKAALAAAERNYAANTRLNELNAIGKVELDTSIAERDKSRADLALIQATLSKCNIYAPYAGRVVEQKVRAEQYVEPGTALLDILDDSALELDFIVPSRWLAWLKPGHTFRVFIDETQKSYPARIQRLGARVDPISQSVKASAVIDGSFSELIAGMSGRIELAPPEGRGQ
ncbi:efflux RND transporter periplasmic adaptor subunit [Denitromonas iodatirespirans]|uniref:efflux RND transporter periplasmic adaptor subunit n=1 Tax=Denitromonas iodatirespirans TaxID=2795389 RepID=UPI001E2B2BD3|nr:efflux RND transporter periplasmic adaptor subunit [Denitromonas iodatirespirans]